MHVGIGSELRQQRVARKIELEAIAAGTKVSLRHLKALEGDDRGDLPGGIFNKGILRSYCRFVGLDETSWMERFAASPMGAPDEPDWEEFAENVRRSRPLQGLRPDRRWGGVALMLLGFVLFAWCAWRVAIQPHVRGDRQAESPAAARATAEGQPTR